MKKIALRAGKDPFSAFTLQETALRGISATNVGNLVFSEAAFKTLSTADVRVIPLGYSIQKIDPQWINEHFDAVVLPFANAFRLAWKDELAAYTRFVSKLTIPVTVMGVGIQTDIEYNLEYLRPLRKQAKSFVSEVLDRSASVGVRGEASKQFLTSLGFHDDQIDVIGCPSMFRYGREFPLDTTKLGKPAGQSTYALNITGKGFNDKGLKGGRENILKITDHNINKYPNSDLLLQNNYSLLTMLWGRGVGKGLEYDDLAPRSKHLLDAGAAKQFVDPSTWIDFLAKKNFVMGSRIHGNITALLSGTPSYVLATDSRTRELCEYFHIPFERASDVVGSLDIEDFKQKADYSKLIANYQDKFEDYVKFLRKNGLHNSFDEPSTGSEFERSLREVGFPGPASGVNSGLSLNTRYRFARFADRLRQRGKA